MGQVGVVGRRAPRGAFPLLAAARPERGDTYNCDYRITPAKMNNHGMALLDVVSADS